MAQGLQVFDENGQIMVDLSDRLTRILGVTSATGNGSLTHSGFTTGTPFAYAIERSGFWTTSLNFSWVGNTMTWTQVKNDYAPSAVNFMIVFGVY